MPQDARDQEARRTQSQEDPASTNYVPSGRVASTCQLPLAWVPVISQAWLTCVQTGSAGSTSASAERRTPGPASGRSPTVRCGITVVNAPPNGGHCGNAPCTAAVSLPNAPPTPALTPPTSPPTPSP